KHLLAGTGTIIPPDIPATLVTFVDNEYLRVAYRAGLIGVTLLVVMYVTIGFNGWRTRRSRDSWSGAAGAAALASVAGLALMGTTAEYLTFAGVFAYALTVASIASILVLDAPIGLARWLPRLRADREGQEAAFSSSVILAAAALAISLLVAIPGGIVLGLRGGTLLGALAIVVGLAFFTLYREAARGQERFLAMMAVFVLANALELVGILVAGALGHRTPTLFLLLYGLSYVAAVLVLATVAPIGLSFRLAAVKRTEMI